MMAEYHDRMPAIFSPSTCLAWLDHEIEDTDILKAMLIPWADDNLEHDRVSRFVNNYRNEGPECIEPESS
jgi:putative SOS response-associated peptidase YedK